jgi:hypothetical protein
MSVSVSVAAPARASRRRGRLRIVGQHHATASDAPSAAGRAVGKAFMRRPMRGSLVARDARDVGPWPRFFESPRAMRR